MNIKSWINLISGVSATAWLGSLIVKIRKSEDETEKEKSILESLELLGMIVWPFLFNQIIGIDKILKDKKLIIPFLIPISKCFFNYYMLKTKKVDEFKIEMDNISQNQLKMSLLTHVLSFSSFMTVISSKCGVQMKESFAVLMSSFILSFIGEVATSIIAADSIRKSHIDTIKSILSTYSLSLLVYIAISNMTYIITNKNNSNNDKDD